MWNSSLTFADIDWTPPQLNFDKTPEEIAKERVQMALNTHTSTPLSRSQASIEKSIKELQKVKSEPVGDLLMPSVHTIAPATPFMPYTLVKRLGSGYSSCRYGRYLRLFCIISATF